VIEIRQILCPVDFSETSRHAVTHAVEVARWFKSKITALYVMNPLLRAEPALFAESAGRVGTGEDEAALQTELRELMSTAAVGLETEVLLDEGPPAGRILERARSLRSDLIVLGTHGRGGFDRLILGSVTEKVLRKASCPVLTVPPPAVVATKLPYERLLCPVDFSESSLSALTFALSIAEEADAHITILHAIEWPRDDELGGIEVDTPAFHRLAEEQTVRSLNELVPAEARVWCKPDTAVGFGKAYQQILETAEQRRADLIVIGVRGRNAVDLMLFGSTTNQVVRHAQCPVLTLKH
jgi:nucleotide-binding universal stress UspA family protein